MPRVLIVDDAAFMRMAIRRMLDKLGLEIEEADNGQEAVRKYAGFQPDLVTMDITMPEMDGIQALKEIRKLDPKAVVVMVSAMGQEAMVREAVLQGAKSFIVKPFRDEQVVPTVKKLLGI